MKKQVRPWFDPKELHLVKSFNHTSFRMVETIIMMWELVAVYHEFLSLSMGRCAVSRTYYTLYGLRI
jgi:hypothetical protein